MLPTIQLDEVAEEIESITAHDRIVLEVVVSHEEGECCDKTEEYA